MSLSVLRTQALDLDLTGYDGIRLYAKGDGRRYAWQPQTDALWQGRRISYWANCETTKGEWQHVDIPFTHFPPRFRGRQLEGPTLDTAKLKSMGLYIYDKKDGPFEFQLSSVSAY